MAFPSSPTNGQQATVNGIVYNYNSDKDAWIKVTTTANILSVSSIITSLGSTIGGNLTVGNVFPTANITQDLGSSSMRWRDLWLSGSTIYLGAANISTDSSNLTIHNPQGARLTVSGNGSQSTMNSDLVTANSITSGNITASKITNSGQFYYNSRTISANVTIATTENAMSVGPITIADGVEVVIADGGEWSIV